MLKQPNQFQLVPVDKLKYIFLLSMINFSFMETVQLERHLFHKLSLNTYGSLGTRLYSRDIYMYRVGHTLPAAGHNLDKISCHVNSS